MSGRFGGDTVTYQHTSSQNRVNRNDRDWTKRWISISMEASISKDYLIPEEFARPPSLVPDDETFLSTSLDFKNFHDGAITRLNVPENVLIDVEGVF